MAAVAQPPAALPPPNNVQPRPTSSSSTATVKPPPAPVPAPAPTVEVEAPPISKSNSGDQPPVQVIEPTPADGTLETATEAHAENPQRPPIRPNTAIRSRFDQEPNPFEQSFSRSSHHSQSSLSDRATPPRGTDATSTRHNALPPLSSLTSPAAADPSQFPWLASHSLRSGPLSPAMLAGPQGGAHPNNTAINRTAEANGNGADGAYDSSTFRTGFTPGAGGTGFTPNYNSFMGGNLGALAMPSPNTAAFLNSITNGTPLAEGSDVAAAAAAAAAGQHMAPHDMTHPPSAIPPHLQAHHPMPHPNAGNEVQQETITPNTLSALTGVFGDMSRAPPQQQQAPPYYTQAMGPPMPVPPPMPQVDYAQQSANAASQAANGLFLLSQAHHELSKREEAAEGRTPPSGPNRSVSGGKSNGAGQKRKSDAGAPKPPAKKGKKGAAAGAAAGAITTMTPPKNVTKQESTSPNFSQMTDDDDEEKLDANGKPETEEDKRKNFLERNRQAALKCRQRKKAWLGELQNKVEGMSVENERLQHTIQTLHDEVGRLNAIIMQHRDCGLGIPPPYGGGRPIR